MKYEIVVIDEKDRLSDESIEFLRNIQRCMEENFNDYAVSKLAVSEDFCKPLTLDELSKH